MGVWTVPADVPEAIKYEHKLRLMYGYGYCRFCGTFIPEWTRAHHRVCAACWDTPRAWLYYLRFLQLVEPDW